MSAEPGSGPRVALIALRHLDYEATLDCVHCGLCLPVCPTYQETGRETSSPRGRISLMRGVAEGRLELDGRVREEMDFCLACRACESACPAGVRYGDLIEGMRAEIASRRWIPRLGQRILLRWVLGSPGTLRLVCSLLRLYQRRGIQRLVRRSRVLTLLPGLARADGMLPPPAEPFRPPAVIPADGHRRGRVALFLGCMMPELLGPASAATVRVLAANGFEVIVPRGQGCCGALHMHAGDAAAAHRLQERNRRAFPLDGIDAVIVNSAGCGATLKAGGDALAAKVRDVTEWLHDVGLRPPPYSVPVRVAYDDPCHLLHGQRVGLAPRELLRSVPDLELIDLPGCGDCCGAAGIYNLTQPEMSQRLLERKLSALREVDPDVVTTGNPGCLLQFGAGIRRAGLDIQVCHPVELLARAYAEPTQR